MRVTVIIDNDDWGGKEDPRLKAWWEKHPDLDALSPREIGDAIAAFKAAVNAKDEVNSFEVILPYWNDDSGDVAEVLVEAGIDAHQVHEFNHIINAVH